MDLGSTKVVKRIYYENMHFAGGSVDAGVRNFTLWGSNTDTDFADLVYNNNGSWVQLTTSQSSFDKHAATDTLDPKFITVTNTTAYRYYGFKFINAWGDNFIGFRRLELQGF